LRSLLSGDRRNPRLPDIAVAARAARWAGRGISSSQNRALTGNAWGMGKFVQGKSGNPGGRPRVVRDLRDLAREHTPDAIATLVTVMNDAKAPHAARVSAANSLIDRGYGKPTQQIDAKFGQKTHEEFLEELPDIEAKLKSLFLPELKAEILRGCDPNLREAIAAAMDGRMLTLLPARNRLEGQIK
jgi:hypothetical protein